ncbi:mpv17-like protein 2 [Leptinotarsa decemlineata]|uniref:mpv17-like protein 2 n=1 Tax=Leptinotarsa decemlineata TaxID=7539 RepID=UPI003D3058AD
MACSEGQYLVKFIASNLLPKFKRVFKSAFSEKYLLLTNLGISVSLSGLGDAIEQRYEIMNDEIEKWNPLRTWHMSVSGLTVGFICHHWYKYLDKFLPGYTLRIVMKKIIVDQLVGSPLCISTFFITIGYLEGTEKDAFIEEIKQKAWKLYAAEWVIWPPAQFINFYLLPNKFRVLFDNTISLGYDIYTSRVKFTKGSSE